MSAAEPAAGPSGEAIPPRTGAGPAESRQPAAPAAEPPTVAAAVNLAPPSAPPPPRPSVGRPAPPGSQAVPPAPRARRRWLRWIRVVALVIALPVAALGIGLLVAWIVHTVRGNPTTAPGPSAPEPSISAVASAPPTTPPHRVVVPADWVIETQPPAGLTFRHPPGWIRRTALPEILRFAPVSPGSTTPGVEGIGAGIEPSVAPSQALQQFVTRAYGTQPQLQQGTITPVSGAHPGEVQEVVGYARAGVPVRVVVRAFSSGDSSVIVLARAASAEPARAAELEATVEASLQISG